ncbi:MAG TPA: SUMF1/EgtB/PvdO family nonheme iron enzyme [Candidatus Bilamarchaeum sp.]|nr:SUMF1/EgtB/PvdO family nonheme iron enzyme [Candidatus Bilamarchaeum sp.]
MNLPGNARLLMAGALISAGCAMHQPPSSPRIEKVPLAEKILPAPEAPGAQVSSRPSGIYSIPESENGCLRNMARAGPFCVDRYEAYLVMQADPGKRHPFNRPVMGAETVARSEAGVFPQGHISQIDAEASCSRAGKRLCTRDEWQSACMGMGRTTYPYGENLVRGHCNSQGIHPPSLLFGASYQNHLNDERLNLLEGGLARSGSHPRCVSDYGVFDMVGNLHEWVSDTLVVRGQLRGVFMGGFYSNDHENGYGCNYMTTAHDPHHFDYSTGFRCCANPKQ